MTKIVYWFLLVMAFVASGCATQPSKISVLPTDAQTLSTLKPNEGIVIIRLADATPTPRYPANYITFAPKDVNAKLENTYKRVESLDEARRSSSTFVAVLPANEYSIESFNQFYTFNQYYIRQFFPADVHLGTFKVEPGKITNLGVVALTIRGTDDKYQFHVVRAGKLPIASKILKDNYPALAAFVTDAEDQLTWNEDDFEEEHQLAYSQAVQNPLTFNNIARNADRTTTLPTRLGTLLHRKGDADWQIEAIDADVDVFSYTRNNGGDEIITAEYNTLMLRQKGTSEWKPLPAPQSGGMLYFAYFGPKNTLYAGAMTSEGATLYRADSFESPTWVPVIALTSGGGITKPLAAMQKKDPGYSNIFFEESIATDNQLILTLNNHLFSFDFATEKTTALLSDASILDINANSSIITVVAGGLFGKSLRISYDNGKTWKSVDNPTVSGTGNPEGFVADIRLDSLSAPLFVNQNLGYAFQKPYDKNASPQLVKTADGGKTWQFIKAESLPKSCYELLQMNGSNAISLQCRMSGEFYLSSDQGQSWTVDKERATN